MLTFLLFSGFGTKSSQNGKKREAGLNSSKLSDFSSVKLAYLRPIDNMAFWAINPVAFDLWQSRLAILRFGGKSTSILRIAREHTAGPTSAGADRIGPLAGAHFFAHFMVFGIFAAAASQVVQSPKLADLFQKTESTVRRRHLPVAARTHVSPYIPILGPLTGYWSPSSVSTVEPFNAC
jgi:hypothetical protein